MAENKKRLPAKAKAKSKNVGGRPTIYTASLGIRICDAIATHPIGLKKLCKKYSWMPSHETIFQWRWAKQNFSDLYTKAKVAQVELYVEDCMDIADDSGFDGKINLSGEVVCDGEAINRARLRVDIRKWMASKLLPRIYGDMAREEGRKDTDEIKEQMRELRADLDAKHKKDY